LSLIAEETIQHIRDRVDIVGLIGRFVSLKKAGASYKGLCPFHNEKTPSFNVRPDRGSYYCFGCQKGGNAITFLMEMENLTFPEAVRALGREVGIEIAETESGERGVSERLFAANAVAQARYSEALKAPENAGAAYLAERGIPFEIVPGVTSSVAAPAYAGIPVTHRDYSSSVSIVTGHRQAGNESEDVIVPNTDTIVYMMGVTNLPNIVKALLESGRSPKTPVAIIRWGTRPQQRTVVGDLEGIAELAVKERINPPSVIVVGEVVKLRDELSWYESVPDWENSLPDEERADGEKAVPFRSRKPTARSGGKGGEQ